MPASSRVEALAVQKARRRRPARVLDRVDRCARSESAISAMRAFVGKFEYWLSMSPWLMSESARERSYCARREVRHVPRARSRTGLAAFWYSSVVVATSSSARAVAVEARRHFDRCAGRLCSSAGSAGVGIDGDRDGPSRPQRTCRTVTSSAGNRERNRRAALAHARATARAGRARWRRASGAGCTRRTSLPTAPRG